MSWESVRSDEWGGGGRGTACTVSGVGSLGEKTSERVPVTLTYGAVSITMRWMRGGEKRGERREEGGERREKEKDTQNKRLRAKSGKNSRASLADDVRSVLHSCVAL